MTAESTATKITVCAVAGAVNKEHEMQVKIEKGRVKVGHDYVAEGDVVHVDDEVGNDLVARGVAVRVQRRTAVSLNLHADEGKEDGNVQQ